MQHQPVLAPPVPAPPVPAAPPATRPPLAPLLAWSGRLLTGALLAMTYPTAVLLSGWLYRWAQGRVLRELFERSPVRRRSTFESFRASLGAEAPPRCPRWFLREPGAPGGLLGSSLVQNLRAGASAQLATFLLAGWGPLLMTFGWEFGWVVSFHKDYEINRIGFWTSIVGLGLCSVTLVYVPLAQVHQAVTGDFRAFFAFRLVTRLIRARLGTYTLFAFVFLNLGLALEILKTLPGGFGNAPFFTDMTDRQLLIWLGGYYLGCGLVLVLSLLATRRIAARFYTEALLDAVRAGLVSRTELHPRLGGWLDRLELSMPRGSLAAPLRTPLCRAGRRVRSAAVLAVLLGVWGVFTAKVYVGEFASYHRYIGFLNEPLVQLPCCNYLPGSLVKSALFPSRGAREDTARRAGASERGERPRPGVGAT